MKKYMNRIDREHHLMIMVVWDYFTQWLGKTKCLTKDERKRVKTACTHLLKTSDSIVERLELDYAKKIIKDMGKVTMTATMSQKVQTGMVIEKEDLYDLASFCLEECRGCQEKQFKQCGRYQLFTKLGIPVAQEETEGCPYEN